LQKLVVLFFELDLKFKLFDSVSDSAVSHLLGGKLGG